MAAKSPLLAFCLLVGVAWLLSAGWQGPLFVTLPGSTTKAEIVGEGAEPGVVAQRRQVLGGLGLAAAVPAAPALAFETVKDNNLGYELKYATGLQKVESKVYNGIFLRDVVEPLESVGLRIIDSTRSSLDEVGPPDVVAQKLVSDLVPEKAPKEIISTISKTDSQGRRFDIVEYRYQWKFDDALAGQLGRKRFQLHCRALVVVSKGKQFTVVASAEEDRWPAFGDQLSTAINTFKFIF